jgi:hypothetical protein
MSKQTDKNVAKLQKAQWFYTFIAALGFVLPLLWSRYGASISRGLARAASGSWVLMLAWSVAVCAAVIGLVYGGRVFIRRPLHLLTLLPIFGCVGILFSTRHLFG